MTSQDVPARVTAQAGRELSFQQALADSACELSDDERYVLRRLAAILAIKAESAASSAGTHLTLMVNEFAAYAGITQKVAHRRLGAATHALFNRELSLRSDDVVMELHWAKTRRTSSDSYELEFTGKFISYLLAAVGMSPTNATPPLLEFADALYRPVTLARGVRAPTGLEVVLVSRMKARKKRPKAMTWTRVLHRVAKRLRKSLPKDRVEDLLYAAHYHAPWARLSRDEYYAFNARDLDSLESWIIGHMDDPDLLKI